MKASIVLIIVVSECAMAGSLSADASSEILSWTGLGADTAWNTAANWDGAVSPDATWDTQFTNAIDAFVTAPAGQAFSVASLDVETKQSVTTFDFAGSTLNVGAYSDAMYAVGTTHLLSNIVMNIDGQLNIGAHSCRDGRLILGGGAHVVATNLFMNWSSNQGLIIESGATLTLAKSVNINKSGSRNYVRVETGGVFTVSTGISVSSMTNYFVIDGGIVTNKYGFNINTCDNYPAGGSYAVVQNGGYLYQASDLNCSGFIDGSFSILNGAAVDALQTVTVGNYNTPTNIAVRSRLVVSNATLRAARNLWVPGAHWNSEASFILWQDEGSRADVTVAKDLYVGDGYANTNAEYACRGNTLLLHGGTLGVTNGTVYLGGPNVASTNNTLAVAGTSAALAAKNLVVTNLSVLSFTIPADGFQQVPVRISGTATIDASTRLVIDATAYKGSGPVTLLTAGALADGSIAATNVSCVVAGHGVGKGRIVQQDNRIEFRPGPGGFVIHICRLD